MFDDFLNDYVRRGKERTATTYYKLLGQFERWLADRGVANFDREHVIVFLDERGWSNSSRNLFLAALRGWAKFTRGYAEDGKEQARLSRIESLKYYTVRREEKQALTLEQIQDLLGAMDPDTAALFWLLLWFGFRVGELKLIQNVDYERGRLVVETEKVGGTRPLFFDAYTAKILKHAIEFNLHLLPEKKIWEHLRRYSSYCAPTKLTPHICRHTFASHFATLTDRDTLRRMLGHGAKETTDIYVHVPEERIREVMVVRHYLKPLEPDGGEPDGG
ncbi:MAG: tyrosine-type recombinase/integrase [Candidatus Hadarchaeales archaeon]